MEIGFITFLAVVVVQGLLVSLILGNWLRSRGWKIWGPVQMWRTRRGLSFMDRLAKKYPRFWKAYGGFGIILAFGFLGGLYVFRRRHVVQRVILSALASLFILAPLISSFLFGSGSGMPVLTPAVISYFVGYGPSLGILAFQSGVDTAMKMLAGQPVVAKAGPVIPGVNIKGSPFQDVPWYGWLAFPILLIVHEVSHGILARLSRIRLKSAGAILAGIMPLGAFVEPDEKQLERARPEASLPLFAAGSTANYLTAFSFLLLLSFFIFPIIQISGLEDQYQRYLDYPKVVTSINPDIPNGIRILSINGEETRTIDDIHRITRELGPRARVSLETDQGLVNTTLNDKAMLGVYLSQDYVGLPIHLSLVQGLVGLVQLIIFFNYVVGLMNLIPIVPLDGGLMFKEFLWKVFGLGRKLASWIANVVSLVFLVGLLLNLLPILFQV